MTDLFFKTVRNTFFCLLLILNSFFTFAQKGIIRGTVIDNSSGEALFGVTVVIKGTTNGAVTDFDGKFEIKADRGVYDIQASFVSYTTITVRGVEVNEGRTTVIDQIRLQEDVQQLEEVIVTAEAIKTTEEALLTIKRKSANVIDGISAASFRRIGDSDAGAAAKRVTGVSVEGGKYVFVRGLGDRYTKTTLNGLDIPSLDPDRNSIQIDIFPTALIDNLVITKSFTPELPADFTGGLVNIETKDFPDEKIFDVSVGVGYNPSMHFQNDYITYEGSNTDFLGFDNGTRRIPDIARTPNIPRPVFNTEQEVQSFLNEFTPTLGVENETSPLNYNVGVTLADQIGLKNENKLGYIFSASYKNSTNFLDDVQFGEYQRSQDETENELVLADILDGSLGERNVLFAGLAGLAYKTNNAKYKFNILHIQNGISRAVRLNLFDNDEAVGNSGFTGTSDNLEYNQRGVTNAFVNGKHILNDNKWQIDWRSSFTLSTQDDPDIRRTPFTFTNQGPVFSPGAAGNPSRLWRELDEINVAGKIDVTYDLNLFNEPSKLKFGLSHVYKERDFAIFDLSVSFTDLLTDLSGDPSEVYTQENLFPNGPLFLQTGVSEPNSNQFNSSANNTGVYVSSEFSPLPNLKSIIGVRAENYVQRHTGRNSTRTFSLDNEKVLDDLDFFPSVNFIYSLSENQNLRFSYSRTIARPSFKEVSFAEILDPVSNRTFIGGLFDFGGTVNELRETRIDNIDLRWELYQERGQLFSVSAFYKRFDDPIELVRLLVAITTANFQPRNVGDGRILGIEVELRKSLDFISPSLSDFSINGNLTLVDSRLDITNQELVQRQEQARIGEEVDDTRDFQGQAPWVINGGFGYNNPENGLEAGLFYNVQGETLLVVGGGIIPDVFSEPFHSLNFNLNYNLGKQRRSTINFSISNLINDDREQLFQSFRAVDQNFYRFSPGTEIGLGFSYSFY